MAKVILRTGGFAFYFMGLLAVLFFCCVLISIVLPICSLIKNTPTVTIIGIPFERAPLWFIPLGVILFGWLTYYLSFYILSSNITLDNGVLIINIFKRPRSKYSVKNLKDYIEFIKECLIVQKKTAKFRLADIESVILGTGKYLDNSPDKKSSRILKNEIESLKNTIEPLVTGNAALPFPVWLAMKYTPFCYFKLKEGNDFFMDTKPFSKRGFVKFLGILREKGIKINTGDLNL